MSWEVLLSVCLLLAQLFSIVWLLKSMLAVFSGSFLENLEAYMTLEYVLLEAYHGYTAVKFI